VRQYGAYEAEDGGAQGEAPSNIGTPRVLLRRSWLLALQISRRKRGYKISGCSEVQN